jgi:hypothetical protein
LVQPLLVPPGVAFDLDDTSLYPMAAEARQLCPALTVRNWRRVLKARRNSVLPVIAPHLLRWSLPVLFPDILVHSVPVEHREVNYSWLPDRVPSCCIAAMSLATACDSWGHRIWRVMASKIHEYQIGDAECRMDTHVRWIDFVLATCPVAQYDGGEACRVPRPG